MTVHRQQRYRAISVPVARVIDYCIECVRPERASCWSGLPDSGAAFRTGLMLRPPQVVRALHAEAALVADYSAQDERTGDEEPEETRIKKRIDDKARP